MGHLCCCSPGNRADQPDTSTDEGLPEDCQPQTCAGADSSQGPNAARQFPGCEWPREDFYLLLHVNATGIPSPLPKLLTYVGKWPRKL